MTPNCWLGKTIVGGIALLAFALPALAGPSAPDADQIVAQLVLRNRQRAESLRQYEGCRHYSLDYVGFPVGKSADMLVAMQFKAPADKQFRIVQEHGSRLLLNRVLKELLVNEREAQDERHRAGSALTPDNYEFHLLGTESLNGRQQYVLQVVPHVPTKFLYRGKVWVDAEDFAVTRIVAEPAKAPSFWISRTEIQHEYTKIGQYWLPTRNVSVTKVRIGGTATLSIRYVNYVIGDAAKAPEAGVCSNLPSDIHVSQQSSQP